MTVARVGEGEGRQPRHGQNSPVRRRVESRPPDERAMHLPSVEVDHRVDVFGPGERIGLEGEWLAFHEDLRAGRREYTNLVRICLPPRWSASTGDIPHR